MQGGSLGVRAAGRLFVDVSCDLLILLFLFFIVYVQFIAVCCILYPERSSVSCLDEWAVSGAVEQWSSESSSGRGVVQLAVCGAVVQ